MKRWKHPKNELFSKIYPEYGLYEPKIGRFAFKCEPCFHINGDLSDVENYIPLKIELSIAI